MKVIHVDDHALFAEGFKAMLTMHTNFEVISLTSAREALNLIDEMGEVDLLLVDLLMPEMNGLSMIEAIERRGLLIPVVVISASEDLWQIRQVMQAGAAGFIPKTANTEEIVSILGRVIRGEIYVPEGIEVGISRLPEQKPKDNVKSIMAHYHITERQLEVLRLMREGYNNTDIATILYISRETVRTHAGNLYRAFNVGDRIRCVRAAEEAGLFQDSRR